VGIIIASFWILSRMITSKMFISLGIVMNGLRKAVESRYPSISKTHESGPFGEFEEKWNIVVSATRDREKQEIATLEMTLAALSGPEAVEVKSSIEEMIREKRRLICADSEATESGSAEESGTDNTLFMQPV
jgi:hypothetical protein